MLTFKKYLFKYLLQDTILCTRSNSYRVISNAYFSTNHEKKLREFKAKYRNHFYLDPQKMEISGKTEDLMTKYKNLNLPSDKFLENGTKWKGYQEGQAIVFSTKYHKKNELEEIDDEVFYNQTFLTERDLSILIYKYYIEELKKKGNFKPISILDAISGTGIKGLRLFKELNMDDIKLIAMNDSIKTFPEWARLNMIINDIDPSNPKLKAYREKPQVILLDATKTVNNVQDFQRFQIIDIDPKGSALPYIENAIQGLDDNDGLLAMNFVDIKVLCGKDTHKTFYAYGSSRAHVHALHEQGLRIALHTISTIATRHNKYITPVISYFADMYFKIIVKVTKSKTVSANSITRYGYIFNCVECPNYKILPMGYKLEKDDGISEGQDQYHALELNKNDCTCDACGGNLQISGPIWIKPINDYEFIQKIYDDIKDRENLKETYPSITLIQGVLQAILQEKPLAEVPLAINFHQLAKFLNTIHTPKKEIVKNLLRGAGYSVVRSYSYDNLYKTNASMSIAMDLMKFWKQTELGKSRYMEGIEPGSAQERILKTPPKIEFKYDADNYNLKEDPLMDDNDPKLFFKNPDEWGLKIVPRRPKSADEKK